MIKTVNDISSLYEGGLIEEDGKYTCPVCNKTYKRKTSAEKHIEKQDCYSIEDMFANTVHETKAYSLYKSMISLKNPRAIVSMANFRKGSLYKNAVKFIVFCNLHEVKKPDLYYVWLRDMKNLKTENQILLYGQEETNLRDYRDFLQVNPTHIDSKAFFNRHKDLMEQDYNFFIRSVEKSHIGVTYLSNDHEDWIVDMLGKVPVDYFNRFIAIYDKVENS